MSAWRIAAYHAIRPILFATDPEAIHHATLTVLRAASASAPGRALCAFVSGVSAADAATAPVELMGLRFRNRIGLGAGFDKDGVAIQGWAALGFGFIELGTVTPRAQAGNPRPRLFRLPDDEALINRMGFNNAGADELAGRIRRARPDLPDGFVVGVNIGRNRDTADERAIEDYAAAARAIAGEADYIAVNVSSPNTPGLRDLQDPVRLIALLDAVARVAPDTPILVKLSTDHDAPAFEALIRALLESPAAGVILSNTTTQRSEHPSRVAGEEGGLSGRPLRLRMDAAVGRARAIAGSRLVIVASGGIGSAIPYARRAADLAQLWTGMIYDGPGLIGRSIQASGMMAPS